ncbi:MAG: hypothetical protein JWR52_3494 [Marmoricola sp.]|nr:hypothetical protein [Marmoricola sp.]
MKPIVSADSSWIEAEPRQREVERPNGARWTGAPPPFDDWAKQIAESASASSTTRQSPLNSDLPRHTRDALDRLRGNEEAKRLLAAEKAINSPLPTATTLADLLAKPREKIHYRVDRLWSVNGRVLFAAQHKAGKTTTAINLAKALVDGGTFLGEFEVAPVRKVSVLDFEMDETDLAEEFAKIGVVNADRVDLYSLRGRANAFNILDDDVRSEWVELLRGSDIVILDCLAPAASALGIDENDNTAMGHYLVMFDQLLAEAGVDEAVVIHHTGHDGKHARGASRILGWGDQNWYLRLDDPNDPASDRFFKAYGRRRVDVPEHGLVLNAETNVLTFDLAVTVIAPGITNSDTTKVLSALANHPEGMAQNAIEAALGWGHGGGTGTRLATLENAELVTIEPGPRRSKIYRLTAAGKEQADDSAY